MIRIENTFARLKKEKRAGLITYIMTCDPTPTLSQEIFEALPAAGADIIELGMAFSDPMADGPTIQDAANRGLAAGASLKKSLEMVAAFRKKNNETPVILMGYFNPILKYGIKKFCFEAEKCGIDGLIIVDLPPEEDGEIVELARAKNIAIIRLISPTTGNERMEKVLKNTSGFVYYISMAGVTGVKTINPASVAPFVQNVKAHTSLPVAVGFGIKEPKQAREIARFSDAVVVGSALISKIGEYAKTYSSKSDPKKLVKDVAEFVKSLKDVI